MIFARGWQLELERLQEGGLKQLSGGPCPCMRPSAGSCYFFCPRLSPSARHDTFPPLFAGADLFGVLVGPVGPGTTCWPQKGIAFSTQNILSREVLRCNKDPLLQLVFMGPGLSLLLRQLEVLDFAAFWAPQKALWEMECLCIPGVTHSFCTVSEDVLERKCGGESVT